MTFDGKQIGEKATSQHDNEASMCEMNPELPPRPAKTSGVRGNKVDQKYCANEMAAGEDRNFPAWIIRRPPNEKALEIALLRLVNSEVNLGDCAGENQNHGCSQTPDGQFEGGDK